MNRVLNQQEINYILFHLQQHVVIDKSLLNRFYFINKESITTEKSIIFRISANELKETEILWLDELPILFPHDTENKHFIIDERGNLIFHHDLLKSAFYLLSGYQEYSESISKDKLGRFNYEQSIQRKLNIITKPVVNYYFEIIIAGLEQFCQLTNTFIRRKRLFNNFGFLLSHDIDYIDQYGWNFFGYKIKELLKITPSQYSWKQNFKSFIRGIYERLQNKNPYWNFDYLRAIEQENSINSTFYFLDQGVKNHDSDYSFHEERVVSLFNRLQQEKCEIGLHGPVRSKTDEAVMKASLHKLQAASCSNISGGRQHRLLWEHPTTARILENIGLQYDTTLGFAAHEGFRNSYCYPFKLYDFDNQRTIDVWEFPLNVMDVTLFAYRKYTLLKAKQQCENLMEEVKKFGGIFTLLWHNSYFDEIAQPGITNFYEELLSSCMAKHPENILAQTLAEKLKAGTKDYEIFISESTDKVRNN